MKFIKKYILITLCLSTTVIANNLAIRVGSVELVGQDISNGFTFVQFDVSWDNSWRTSAADPYNNDAIWVFVKYKVEGETEWKHATLSSTVLDHSVTINNSVAAEFKVGLTGSAGKGVFIQRAADGSGSINWDQVKLKWLYGDDGVLDDANVTVRVFAIEMVYIPQGSFSVGDGLNINVAGHLHRADDPSVPFLISSETQFWLGSNLSANMGSNDGVGQYRYLEVEDWIDDFGSTAQFLLSTAYPKGYNAFYIMKYEITQGQYADFLNCLTRTQQNNRTSTDLSSGITSVTNRYVMSGTQTVSGRNSIKCAALISSSDPVTFYCDFNDDDNPGDGKDIACNFLHVVDGSAYADWAGLRPFTELEFEKACRGSSEAPWNQTPLTDEYGWGTTSLHSATYLPLTSEGAPSELPNNPSTTVGNSAYNVTVPGVLGPLRSGIFATGVSDRIVSGASYYGVMELTGNLWEAMVNLSRPAGRLFIGTHGDGFLNVNGGHNVSDWPGNFPGGLIPRIYGTGYRGGGIGPYNVGNLRISYREFANVTVYFRDVVDGMRLARTAP